MKCAEDCLRSLSNSILTACPDDVKFLSTRFDNKCMDRIQAVLSEGTFQRVSYTEAVEILQKVFKCTMHSLRQAAPYIEVFLEQQIGGLGRVKCGMMSFRFKSISCLEVIQVRLYCLGIWANFMFISTWLLAIGSFRYHLFWFV